MAKEVLHRLGISTDPSACAIGGEWRATAGRALVARSPIDGRALASLQSATAADVAAAVSAAHEAFLNWRLVPAPNRGELVRRYAVKLRERKGDLAALVTLEVGKITSEALGEVQEMIDIADFAV